MYWLRNIFAFSVVVAGLTSCTKKEKPPVFIEPALLDTIFSSTYEGMIPCPDCPGIETTIRIYSDSTVSRTVYYQEKNALPVTRIGKWKLRDSIFTTSFDRDKLFYKIKAGGRILRVGSDLKEVKGAFAEDYVLYKAVPFTPEQIEGQYSAGDTLSLHKNIVIKHSKKDQFNVRFIHSNALDSLDYCETKYSNAVLDKEQQLNIPLNKEEDDENLKIIFTKKEAHVVFENIHKDSVQFKCNDSLRSLPLQGRYAKQY